MAGEVRRAPDWGPARGAPYLEVAASGRAGGWDLAGAGGRDAPRGECEPFGGEHLSPLRPGSLGRAMAAAERTRRYDHRTLRRRLRRGVRAPGRRRTVLDRTAGTVPAVQSGAAP